MDSLPPSFAQKILKVVEINAVTNKAKNVEVKISDKVSSYLKENFIDNLNFFEKKNKIKIEIISDNSLSNQEYVIILKNKSQKIIEKIENYEIFKTLKINDASNLSENTRAINKKKTYKKKAL